MDANKLKVLRDLQYRIPPVCGLCKHGEFVSDDWGGCKVQTYEHLKHERTHPLSIHRFGSCPKFEADPKRVARLNAFAEFASPRG